MTNLWQLFAATAHRDASRDAIVEGGRPWTFAQWLERATDYAAAYRAAGIRADDRILLRVRNSTEIAAALAGAWGAGAIPCLLDSSAPPAHVAHAVSTVAPRLLVTDDDDSWSMDLRVLHARDVASSEAVDPGPRALPSDVGLIDFTSGSTGPPKAVAHAHGSLARGCRAVAGYLGLSADSDSVLCPVPWSFSYGSMQLQFAALLGITHVLPEANTPFAICESLGRDRPTVLAGLPSLYTYLLRGVSPVRSTDLSSLRLLVNTGGAIPRPVLDEMLEVFAHCRIALNYGLTESYRSAALDPALVRTRGDSLGRPIPGVDLIVVREDGSLAGHGEVGEIVHRGDYLCLGYWNDPDATARALRPDPLSPAGNPFPGRVLFTGDLGYRDADGFLYFKGRRDRQLKSMGVRVSPDEIEELLFASGLASEVAVFGMPHDLMGDEVWAAVVAKGPAQDVKRELERYARPRMSQYMQPRRWLVLQALPRTPNGKVDYPGLKAAAAPIASAQLTARA
jgi:acyl-CoA synthetase (AMP-forming)/AMP-acid ligase II